MKTIGFYVAFGLGLLAIFLFTASPTLRLLSLLVALVVAVGAALLHVFGHKIDLGKFRRAIHDLFWGL